MTKSQIQSQLAIYPLHFTVEVQTPLKLTKPYGAQLRGALYEALLKSSCTTQHARSSGISRFHKDCPARALMAPLRDETLARGVKGGRDQPRPYVIRPPQEVPPVYYPGQHFTFELLLFGQSIDLLPYLIQAIPQLEQAGPGASPGENQSQRGRSGELQPFRELLSWGELCHVGRSYVKGNGHYRLMP
jgi:hypothetical protein